MKNLLLPIVVLLIIGAGIAGFWYYSTNNSSDLKPTPPLPIAVTPPKNTEPPAAKPTIAIGPSLPQRNASTPKPTADSTPLLSLQFSGPPKPKFLPHADPPTQTAHVALTPIPPADPAAEVLVPEPIAREALASVGADPDADDVWAAAINDPNMPPEDRANLIEDLNEEGFPDPKNITIADLPLIESRLAIIEELGPEAMDDTNYAAFQEAYKDLQNMRAKLTGQ